MAEKNKILFVGSTDVWSLEMSYVRAAKAMGYDVMHFDPNARLNKYIKGSSFGRKLHLFLPVDAWDRKMNRELVIAVKEFGPDCVLLFGPAKIFAGTLATIKIISSAPIGWVWPDTPMNLLPHNFQNGPLLDLTATYSEKSMPHFEKLGFGKVQWVPLAGDLFMHQVPMTESPAFAHDLSFVGMWRPEREKAMSSIVRNFPSINIALYGKYWQRNCHDKELMKKWIGEGIVGKDLGVFFNKTRINLNVIDDTNYPAANMRFFEICTAGGLELTSSCPEMAPTFHDKRDLLYFNNEHELLGQLQWALDNPVECQKIRRSGQQLIVDSNSYGARFHQIVQSIFK